MKFLFLSAFFLIATTLFSQDYIIKKNGEKLEVSVKEISSSLISYRNFSQPNGPDRVIEISKVKEIIYADGQFEKFDTPKPAETVETTPAQTQPVREIPLPTPEEDLRSTLRRDRIMKSGLTVEGIFGASSITYYELQQITTIIGYDQFGNPIYGIDYEEVPSTITHVSLNVKLANKWYFNQSQKWRTGLQVNWFRFGINIDPDNIFESLFLGPKILAPLNVGWTNVVRLSENLGIEANITGGAVLNIDFLEDGFTEGYAINPEVKLRFKKLSFGLDYMYFDVDKPCHTFGVTIGAKL
jgi:hypothetical protein